MLRGKGSYSSRFSEHWVEVLVELHETIMIMRAWEKEEEHCGCTADGEKKDEVGQSIQWPKRLEGGKRREVSDDGDTPQCMMFSLGVCRPELLSPSILLTSSKLQKTIPKNTFSIFYLISVFLPCQIVGNSVWMNNTNLEPLKNRNTVET